MTPQLQQILTEIDRLSTTEQMEVLSHTVELVKQNLPLESSNSRSQSLANIDLDPDAGLEVKPEVIEQLQKIRHSNRPMLTSDEVKQRLGLT
jgi:hypothetical protein